MSTPTIPAGNLYMNATTYNGTGTTQVVTNGVTGQSFQPDFIWFKSRSGAYNHALYDSIRGNTLTLNSNTTSADTNTGTDFVSFNSNGFTVNTYNIVNSPNYPGETAVAWQWKANGTAVSNTAGSITSQVSANTTSGFSVVGYTGTGANATVGHGLGVAPAFMIVRNRVAVGQWAIYHQSLGNTNTIYLNLTNAVASQPTFWNSTSPTSSVFSVGTDATVNGSTNGMIAYCWAPIAGYSAFGSYIGNGSADGPFVYTGFRPKFILAKSTTSGSENWYILDSSRNTYNVADALLNPNLANAEQTYSQLDFLSNGFKIRNTGTGMNASGATMIYAAFAENPFKYANAR